MGLDICGVFQRKEADRWIDVASNYTRDRDYELYSWLGAFRYTQVPQQRF